jgi:hypothetical protein
MALAGVAVCRAFLLFLLAVAGALPLRAGDHPRPPKPPFSYESLRTRNSCFVDSVHFYDEYLRHHHGEDLTWARVLEWGNEEGDFKLTSGHAVAVFVAKHQLWTYDVNYGMFPLNVSVERREDLRDVSPPIFAHYPQYEPIFPRYRDDFPQQPPKKRVEYQFYHKNRDVRDATKVANELGRERPVRVFEFEFKENGQLQRSAGAAFVFGAHACIYFPRHGTYVAHVSTLWSGSIDDTRYLQTVVKRLFPGGDHVKWQPGGYLLFPPKEKK